MKLGLGDSYNNVSVLTPKARAYLDLTKPASSVGAGLAYFIASLFYFFYVGEANQILNNFWDIAYAVLTVALVHGGSQAMNMAEDAEMDKETPHKQNRPIPAGIVTEEEARTIAWILILFGVGRAFVVSRAFGIMISILAFMGIFYNLSPIRAKERIISIPWQAASRGFLSFPIVWAAYGDMFSITPWILGLFMFFYVFGFQNAADIIDRDVDEKYGIKTFVVVFGVDKIPYIAAGSVLLMCSVIISAVGINLLPFRLLGILGILPFCFVMLYHLTYNPYSVNEKTGNHPAWLWMYIGLVLTVTIPFVIELLRYTT